MQLPPPTVDSDEAAAAAAAAAAAGATDVVGGGAWVAGFAVTLELRLAGLPPRGQLAALLRFSPPDMAQVRERARFGVARPSTRIP